MKQSFILEYIKKHPDCSSGEIFENNSITISYATIKRILNNLVKENFIETSGKGKSTRYRLTSVYELQYPLDVKEYFEKEIDEREIKDNFNFSIFNTLENSEIFTAIELQKLKDLQNIFNKNISQLTENEFKNEFERLAIDLSWKSSQIEGNTYSLLETEHLLREKQTASGKTKDEAVMLLNHKYALDFIMENTDYLSPLRISGIEDIHSLLVKELEIDKNLRRKRVGISGTNYRPLDNEFQIKEALEKSCILINLKTETFEKALLSLLLLSYIQPFMDGNKRTARIVCNAILMNNKYCPISFRTVDPIEYKKAMLIFYEQNNLSAFKKMFIEQFEFAVNTYF